MFFIIDSWRLSEMRKNFQTKEYTVICDTIIKYDTVIKYEKEYVEKYIAEVVKIEKQKCECIKTLNFAGNIYAVGQKWANYQGSVFEIIDINGYHIRFKDSEGFERNWEAASFEHIIAKRLHIDNKRKYFSY